MAFSIKSDWSSDSFSRFKQNSSHISIKPDDKDKDFSAPFVYSIVPIYSISENQILFAGSCSNDSIVVFELDCAEEKTKLTVRYTLQNSHAGITCLSALLDTLSETVSDNREGHFVSAGRDGIVKVWKANLDSGQVISQISLPDNRPISAIATYKSGSKLLFAYGTETEEDRIGDVEINVVEISSDGQFNQDQGRTYTEGHSGDITSLRFYNDGTRPVLASGSTDGLINLYDLEEIQEEDAIISVVNNRSAVAHFIADPGCKRHAMTLPQNMLVVSHDEQAAVYRLQDDMDTSKKTEQPEDMRKILQCDYVIGCSGVNAANTYLFAGAYKPETLGAAEAPRVDCYMTSRTKERHIARLEGAHGEEVVRDIWLGPSRANEDASIDVILTCGEDGYIRAWNRIRDETGSHPRGKRSRENNDEPSKGKKLSRRERP